ncbi:hypothetical protein SAMN05421493_1133 [Pseudobutyrivibrio sp. 49]|uniref:EGFR-like transmembrane domain-containing protein n=1 Tax=Pseudobutyrivibrio sp. 49 TaxID=1855344 RepID=UPI000887C379|nr:transmembrane domain-containing protein [Pseudobutyrivibrio sp. 49]SDI38001.1 hypothetical protein SAMN05421493_1133 [Pseudobutyrivibrio sp. 49]
MSDNTNSKGSNGLKIAIAVGVVVIIALLGVIIFLLVGRHKEEPEKRNVVVTQDNVEDVVQEMASEDYIEPGYYEASMSTTWTFATGSDVSDDAYVANVEGNTNDVYFDVVLAEDEDQVIYKSPVIPIGGELQNIALDTPLEAGTYDCVCIYHLIDEEQNTISTLRVGITVKVNQ